MSTGALRNSIMTILMFCFSSLHTPLAADDFLPMSKAFQTNISVQNGLVTAHWTIAPEYYLYQKSLDIQLEAPSAPDNPSMIVLGQKKITPKGKTKQDEFMGEVVVHYNQVSASRSYTLTQGQDVTLIATFQGCAEAGLCYPPSTYKQTIKLPAFSGEIPQAIVNNGAENLAPESNNLNITGKPLWQSIFIFFVLGLGLSLTPCVLPMVPILSSIILGSDKQKLSARRGFGLSLSYVLGMALIYTGAGLLVALSGARLQIYMQHPYVLWPLAAAFVVLAISLFGAFEIRLPTGLHNRLYQFQSKIPGGQYAGVFLIGALSAIVVSPCVSAPLAGILLYIAQEGNAHKGAASLFALAMGMGAPLIFLGTTGANILPHAGVWMERVKVFFGFMMIAMAIYLVKHLIPEHYLFFMNAVLVAFFAIWLGALHQTSTASSTLSLFGKAIGLCFLVIAALLMQSGWYSLFPPQYTAQNMMSISGQEHISEKKLDFNRVTTLLGLNQALLDAKNANTPAMVDLYADWCISCIEFEKITFEDPQVKNKLHQLALIKLDITEDIETTKILDHFNLIGPPTLLFYDENGQELKELRVTGFMEAQPFMKVLDQVTQSP